MSEAWGESFQKDTMSHLLHSFWKEVQSRFPYAFLSNAQLEGRKRKGARNARTRPKREQEQNE
eukprot:14630647-Heterocapsa_arctica.AAC.1